MDSEAFDEGFQDKRVINVIKKILSLYLLAFIEVGGARRSADGQWRAVKERSENRRAC